MAEQQYQRGAMHHGSTKYGAAHIGYMTGDEAGYATGEGEVKLTTITLPAEAVALIQAGKAVRILEDGGVESVEGERAGVIVFGRFKGDRPRIGGR